MKATIIRPDGTRIEVEGTAEEIARLAGIRETRDRLFVTLPYDVYRVPCRTMVRQDPVPQLRGSGWPVQS